MSPRARNDPRLLTSPSVGCGRAPDGRWELRAEQSLASDSLRASLALYIDLRRHDGRVVRGFGCSGVGFANDERPIVLSVSGRGADTSFCYIGQATHNVNRVRLSLSDDTDLDAVVLPAELPAQLWVAFTDGNAVPLQARGWDGARQVGSLPITVTWPAPRSSYCWGPIDN